MAIRVQIAAADPVFSSRCLAGLPAGEFEVHITRTGEECAAAASRRLPDVVLMGKDLPCGIDAGITLLCLFDLDREDSPIPVFALTEAEGQPAPLGLPFRVVGTCARTMPVDRIAQMLRLAIAE
jgi:hypothetical protein